MMDKKDAFADAVRLNIPKRHVYAAVKGVKTQVIVMGRKTPVPDPHADKRFVLVTGGIAVAHGYASETTDFRFDFDNGVFEIDYQYWDGESEGVELRCPTSIQKQIDAIDSESFREFAHATWWRGDREAFARREGFRDWAALARFHKKGDFAMRGTVVRWTAPLEIIGDPLEDIPDTAPWPRNRLSLAA